MKSVLRFLLSIYVLPKNIILYMYGTVKCHDAVVNELCSKGFYIYSDRLSKKDIVELREDYEKLLDENIVDSDGQLNGRIYKQGEISSLVSKYVKIYGVIANKYFNTSHVDCELTMYQKSVHELDMSNIPGGKFHMDDNKKNLKFFIYLSDVSIKNGPFRYVPKTHGLYNIKKILKWWLWEITLKRKYLYVSDFENMELKNRAESVLGKSGTVFCADTTGYHAASVVERGCRLVLVISFAEKRLDPYALLN